MGQKTDPLAEDMETGEEGNPNYTNSAEDWIPDVVRDPGKDNVPAGTPLTKGYTG